MFSNVTQHIKNRKKDKERIKTQKDFLIKNYGVHTNIDIFRKFIPYVRLINLLEIKTNNILDLGCGFGTLTKCLSLIGKDIEALDHFDEAIQYAKEKNKFITNIKYISADIYKYTLEKNKYDLIFASEFHPFTRNYYQNHKDKENHHDKIMVNIYNALKENGHLIISHAIVAKQAVNVKKHTHEKFDIIIYELDERIIYLFDSFFRMFKSEKIYINGLKLFTIIRKLLFKLKIMKNLKLIYILKKKKF